MQLAIPDFALVVLMGAAGSGKSTFAARHFAPAEIVPDAGEAAAGRLATRALAVIDARHLRAEERQAVVRLARRFHAPPVAIALDLPEAVCDARNYARQRGEHDALAHAVRGDAQMLRHALPGLGREGFRTAHVLSSVDAVDAAAIAREPLACDLRGERGPFDIVGDIHGCYEELAALLACLGYAEDP